MRQFLKDRVEATKTEIIALEEAVAAITEDGVMSYTIDTGQSRQTVTRYDLGTLIRRLDSLYNRLATLKARLDGSSYYGRPSF